MTLLGLERILLMVRVHVNRSFNYFMRDLKDGRVVVAAVEYRLVYRAGARSFATNSALAQSPGTATANKADKGDSLKSTVR